MKAERTHYKSSDNGINLHSSLSFCDEICSYWSLVSLLEDAADQSHINERYVLAQTAQTILLSPTGSAFLQEAAQEGWSFGLGELENQSDFHIDVPRKAIILNNDALAPASIAGSDYFRNMVMINMILALRDVWQERRHGAFDELYGPEDVLMLERIRNADCDTLSILIAWEIRSEGHCGLWRHMIGSENGDMALTFSQTIERNPSSLFNGQALAETFRQWYECEDRINECDHGTLEYLDHVIKQDACYTAFGHKQLTPVGIEVLSCLPDKTAYLQGHGDEIMRNPDFAGLLDPINQSHFFHIVHDMQAVRINDVAFRDGNLARKIFPEGESDLNA